MAATDMTATAIDNSIQRKTRQDRRSMLISSGRFYRKRSGVCECRTILRPLETDECLPTTFHRVDRNRRQPQLAEQMHARFARLLRCNVLVQFDDDAW